MHWLLRLNLRDRGAMAPYLGIGVLVGAATIFKYQGATFLGVAAGALLLDVAWRRRGPLNALGALALTGAGFLVVPGLYLLRAYRAGALESTWYWFSFNFAYVSAGPSGSEMLTLGLRRAAMIGGVAIGAYGFGLWGAARAIRDWVRIRRPDDPEQLGADLLGVLWLASSALALCAGGRFFGHYFHHVLPPLCLLAAGPLLETWDRARSLRPVIVASIALPAVVFVLLATAFHQAVHALDDPEPPYEIVGARLRMVSETRDRLFVWGNSPQLYVEAERPMGSRFSFCNYMTGVSPGTRTETGDVDASVNALPAAWTMLLDDLERRKPRWIADAAAAGWDGYHLFPMSRYAVLDDYVRSHYKEHGTVQGVVLYERMVP